jgi:hypothetical protein
MSDFTSLVTALILDTPLCVPCIADDAAMSPAAVEVTLGVLAVGGESGRCRRCCVRGTVYFVARAKLSRGER